jgi:hypothetical protein
VYQDGSKEFERRSETEQGRDVLECLEKISVLHHAPYSPDLAPCDFFLFPKLKHSLKGTHFQSIEDIRRKTTGLLKGFTQHYFHKCFHAWKERMQHCIEAQGNYFEGDNLQHT